MSFNEMQVLPLALHYRDNAGALDGIYVYDNGIVKGMLRRSCAEDGQWELNELYVDAFFQGEGIGTALMKDFITSARAQGARGASLWVLEKNTVARRFYESHGYLASGKQREFPGSGQFILEYVIEFSGDA